MANVKITDLAAYTAPETTDVLPIVDVAADATKKVSVGEVVGKITGDVDVATNGTSSIAAGAIVNADVNAAAAIAGTKIDPDFGSQTVETTGVFSAAAGAAATPSITFTGDLNTGIYSPDANQVAVATNGTGRLFVDSSGNVGIGTSNPSKLLVVTGDASINNMNVGRGPGNNDSNTVVGFNAFNSNTTGYHSTAVGQQALINNTEGGNNTAIGQGSLLNNTTGEYNTAVGRTAGRYIEGSNNTILGAYQGTTADATLNDTVIISAGTTERLRIDSDGYVGIGTTNPSTRLEVSRLGSAWTGAAPIGGSTLFIHNGNNGDSSPSNLQFGAGNASLSSIYFGDSDAANIGAIIYRHLDNSLNFNVNVSERMRIDSSGNVGIGTSNPQVMLDVKKDNATGEGGSIAIRNTGAGLGTSAALYLAPNPGGGDDLARAASVRSRQSVSGNFADLGFFTSPGTTPTERMTIDAGGRVGIGTTSPEANLEVQDTNPTFHLKSGNDTGSAFVTFRSTTNTTRGLIEYKYTDNALCFATNGSAERLRIDSSGRLLVGTSTSNTIYGAASALQVAGSNFSTASISVLRTGDGTGDSSSLYLARKRTTGIVSNGDRVGLIAFAGRDTTDINTPLANIAAEVDGTTGSNDMPGRLVFSTTASGESSPTERMRIDSAGNIIGSASPTPSSAGARIGAGGDAFFARAGGSGPLALARTTSNGTQVTFYNQGSTAGSITTNSTTTTQYNTSSDYRLKENRTAVTDGITRLQQLKPCRFNFIADPDTVVDGFLAHEVQTIVPEAITGEKDAVDDEGNPVYQGIDQSKLVPLLTAALQEAIGRIETLEAEVAQLKGA